jgi:hypothetical protein
MKRKVRELFRRSALHEVFAAEGTRLEPRATRGGSRNMSPVPAIEH